MYYILLLNFDELWTRSTEMDIKHSRVGLNDLPDELLLIIFQKLNNIQVLYSLMDVNERLSQTVSDPILTSYLIFVKQSSSIDYIDLLSSDMMRDRFSFQILPKIHHQIQHLHLQAASAQHILHVAHYPHLFGLGIYNIDEDIADSLFTGKMFEERKETICIVE